MDPSTAISKETLTAGQPERAKLVMTLFSEVICLISVFVFGRQRLTFQTAVALVSLVLAAVPYLLERYSGYSMTLPLYLFVQCYSLGALLGDGYNWYYLIPYWDKIMHCSGGVAFAILGFWILELADKKDAMNLGLRAAFAVCFSVTVSALWEFFEFGMDWFFGMDMQGDTYISSIHSYILGTEVGTVGSIPKIESVTVNGVQLPGYIDTGIIDTMLDMLVETAGALVLAAAVVLQKGSGSLFTPREKEQTGN